MTENYSVHLPESSSPGNCFATFATAITAFAIELGTYFDNQMRAKEGDYWFEDLVEFRVKYNKDPYNYKNYRSFYDFSWIMNEPLHNQDSPIRDLLPKNVSDFYYRWTKLLEARNKWYHDHNPHNIGELRAALNKLKFVADKCGLALADDLVPVLDRVNKIANGTYKPEVTSSAKVPEPPKLEPKPLRQSAVGAAWLGPLGSRKIQLTGSGALIDLGSAKNVSNELGEASANRYFQLWKKLELDWLWIDALGSVAAYVQGSLRMVGYWGSSSEEVGQDPFAKFLLPHSYALSKGELIHLETLKSLDMRSVGLVTKSTIKRATEAVQDDSVLRLTWDGDLIQFGDNGPEYLGEIESGDWFAGHFFMPTN